MVQNNVIVQVKTEWKKTVEGEKKRKEEKENNKTKIRHEHFESFLICDKILVFLNCLQKVRLTIWAFEERKKAKKKHKKYVE